MQAKYSTSRTLALLLGSALFFTSCTKEAPQPAAVNPGNTQQAISASDVSSATNNMPLVYLKPNQPILDSNKFTTYIPTARTVQFFFQEENGKEVWDKVRMDLYRSTYSGLEPASYTTQKRALLSLYALSGSDQHWQIILRTPDGLYWVPATPLCVTIRIKFLGTWGSTQGTFLFCAM